MTTPTTPVAVPRRRGRPVASPSQVIETSMTRLLDQTIVGGPSECWPTVAKTLWWPTPGPKRRRSVTPQAFMWAITRKLPIPNAVTIRRNCKTPTCANDGHLVAGWRFAKGDMDFVQLHPNKDLVRSPFWLGLSPEKQADYVDIHNTLYIGDLRGYPDASGACAEWDISQYKHVVQVGNEIIPIATNRGA